MEDSFDFVPPTSVLAPAIMAVAAVNIIIVAYVVKAFRWYEIPCSTHNILMCEKLSYTGCLFVFTGSSQSSKYRSVSKFWHLELFCWDSLYNLILFGRNQLKKKTPCILWYYVQYISSSREEQLQEKNKIEWRETFSYLCAFSDLWFLRSLLQ